MYTKNNQEKRNLSLQYHLVIRIHNIFPCLYLTFDLFLVLAWLYKIQSKNILQEFKQVDWRS